MTHQRTVAVDGHEVFYREAGASDCPAVPLLHGFPTSSHMFRNLMPRLADRVRVVAPDLPGFGFTRSPEGFAYGFASLAEVVAGFTDAIGLERHAMYVFHYGAPVGFRLACAAPSGSPRSSRRTVTHTRRA
jgi:pimeloyl-ACP methyl ester carboxylesterase